MADGGSDRGTGPNPGSPQWAFEGRLGRLETELSYRKKVIEDLRIEFARFEERSKQFPTKGFIFSTSAAMLGTMTAFMALIVRFLPPAS